MVFEESKISFRNLTIDDLSVMHRWLNTPFVHEWYDKDKSQSVDEIKNRYFEDMKRNDKTHSYIILYDNSEIGYIQTYKLHDYYEEYGKFIGLDEHTAGVDLFIGDNMYIGKGLGPIVIRRFLKDIVFSDEGITSCIMGPEPDNKRAIKSYENAGFKHLKNVLIPGEDEEEYIMQIFKKDLL